MSTSQLQTEIGEFLKRRFHPLIIIENIRPSWLINDRGERLELDFYMPQIDVAIEVQGRQHYQFVEQFHKNHRGFEEQKRRDDSKRELCEGLDINLLEISSTGDLEGLAHRISQCSGAANAMVKQREILQKQIEIHVRRAIEYKNQEKIREHQNRAIELAARHGFSLAEIKPDTTLQNDPVEALILDTPRVRLIGINEFDGKRCTGNLIHHRHGLATVSVRNAETEIRTKYHFDPDTGDQYLPRDVNSVWRMHVIQFERSVRQFYQSRRLCRICGFIEDGFLRKNVRQDRDGRFKCGRCYIKEREK